ncbi:lipopolysaccharide biosynthesis protein [Salimicrobium album]|uniref:Membrane protein involved in the export of O-antigen and teichoic acid n=1 Tax=Salimicrobium album TaxID=50717 RepID=A0A1H3CY73_9BACI|nr:lipopolysaccharide biosynthesis protein [Salimicrobium album]SDX58399.1 Membrane protein involved in the export of O-antigen and teichoic acid [Salimicrobium album]
MNALISRFLKGGFIRKVLVMVSGTAGAQAIILLASPVITRIYGPEAFGVLGVFMAVSMILIPASGLGYPIAIVLPKHEEEAVGLTKISLWLSVGMALLSLVIAFLFGEELLELLNFTDINNYLYFIPLVILFGSLLQISEQWAVRLQEFGVIARTNMYHALIVQGSMVGIGLIYPFAFVLILMNVIGQLLKAVFMGTGSLRKRKSKGSIDVTHPPLKETARKYKDFPRYRAPEMFLNAVSQNIPIMLLSSLFGPAAAGFFTLSRRVLAAPATLIGKAVGDVFYPRITEAYYNKESLQKLIKKATLGLSLAGLIPYGTVVLLGPWLFGFVFGDEWVQAGEYARWMALASFFGFINSPSVKALPVLSAQGFQLLFTIVMLTVRIAMLAVGSFVFESDLVAIALFGLSGAVLNSLLIMITINISKKFDETSLNKTEGE